MSFLNSILGVSTLSKELQNLSIKYFVLEVIVSGIYLSYTWISLYYISVLDSFSTFGVIVAIGMLFGAILDVPLGVITDRIGQKSAFCGAFICLLLYYFGLIFARNPKDLLFLELLVGIYSALISGSFISWFLNSWESLMPKKTENAKQFRNVMANVSFAKSIIIALAIFVGGILLQQSWVIPQTIFLIQAFIAILGVLLGIKYISEPKKRRIFDGKEKNNAMSTFTPSQSFYSRLFTPISKIKRDYFGVIPYFMSFSLLSFTSVSFSALVFSPLLYEICSLNQTFDQDNIVIQYTTLSLMFITLTHSLSNVIFGFVNRISGKMTSFIQSSYNGVLVFYVLNYPVVWLAFLLVLVYEFPILIKLGLILIIFLVKIILSGLSIGLYWQLYYKITSSKIRSSQESLLNTIDLILSLIGIGLLGIILESYSFIGALQFLLVISCLGIFLLIYAKNPEVIAPLEPILPTN